MAITNYSTLQAAIADYLNRADLTSQIQNFIQFAEADLNTRLRCREQIVRAEATSSAEFVQLPADPMLRQECYRGYQPRYNQD